MKTLGRRLFARQAAVAPLAVDLIAQRAAQPMMMNAPTESAGLGLSHGNGDSWNLVHKLMKAGRSAIRLREERAHVTGGLDPDILALRSISPSYKARMLAEARRRLEQENETLWQWAKRKAGLPEDA